MSAGPGTTSQPGRSAPRWIDFREARELAWRFFLRDFRAKYGHSLLGVLGGVIVPFFAGAL